MSSVILKDAIVTKGEKSYMVDKVSPDGVGLVCKSTGARFDATFEKLRKNGYRCTINGKDLLSAVGSADPVKNPINDPDDKKTASAQQEEMSPLAAEEGSQDVPVEIKEGAPTAGCEATRQYWVSIDAASSSSVAVAPGNLPTANPEPKSGDPDVQEDQSMKIGATAIEEDPEIISDERIIGLQNIVYGLECQRDADIEKIKIKYAEKIRKVTEKMKPLSVRRQEAYDLVLSLREVIRKNIDASLSDEEADKIIVAAVTLKAGSFATSFAAGQESE